MRFKLIIWILAFALLAAPIFADYVIQDSYQTGIAVEAGATSAICRGESLIIHAGSYTATRVSMQESVCMGGNCIRKAVSISIYNSSGELLGSGIATFKNQSGYWHNLTLNTSAYLRNGSRYVVVACSHNLSAGDEFGFYRQAGYANGNDIYGAPPFFTNSTSDFNFILWSGTESLSYIHINFTEQKPSDLTTINAIGGMNITYNVSNTTSVSSVTLKYRSGQNGSCWVTTDGNCTALGYISRPYSSAAYPNYTFNLEDNSVLPGNYMVNETLMELNDHSAYQITGITDYVLGTFRNVSADKQYNIYEDMVINSSGTGGLRHYYCNSSYDLSSLIATSPNCVLFYTLASTSSYNHTHNRSKHQIVPLSINSSGYIGDVRVSPLSYIAVRGIALTTWNVSYLPYVYANLTNSRYTATGGTAWSSLNGTWDMHLHQFMGNDSLCYYANAEMSDGKSANSSIRCDAFDVQAIPPNSPVITSPVEKKYNTDVWINYSLCTSSYGSIRYHNITIYNYSSANITFTYNNSMNASYLWASSDGSYKARVTCYDNNSLSAYDESVNFSVDKTAPNLSLQYPWNNANFTSYSVNLSVDFIIFSDGDYDSCILWDNYTLNTSTNLIYGNNTLVGLQYPVNASYLWYINCTDDAGNRGQSESWIFSINQSFNVTAYSGTPPADWTVDFDITTTPGVLLLFFYLAVIVVTFAFGLLLRIPFFAFIAAMMMFFLGFIIAFKISILFGILVCSAAIIMFVVGGLMLL